MQKHSYSNLTKKAFALLKDGQIEEAYDITVDLKRQKPLDDATLQALTMTYKTLSLYEDIVEVYENAFTIVPNHEEWANHWFMALVRLGDFKKIQQVHRFNLGIKI